MTNKSTKLILLEQAYSTRFKSNERSKVSALMFGLYRFITRWEKILNCEPKTNYFANMVTKFEKNQLIQQSTLSDVKWCLIWKFDK